MDIIEKVMEKKPYSFVNKKFIKKLSKLIKAKDEREKLKLMRAKLRKISGSALPLKFYKKFKKLEFSPDLLKMHRSIREREAFYPWLINEIKKYNNIVDLGCGFNLIAFYYHDFLPKKYLAYDVDCAVVEFISRFASEKKLNAEVFCQDIAETRFKDAEIYLCLKLFDALEDVEWGITEKILRKLKSKTRKIIVSFSNISLSGKGRLRERDWFEKILKKLKMKFEKTNKDNENFYFISV